MNILSIHTQTPLPPPHDLGAAKRSTPFLEEVMSRHSVSVISFGTPFQKEIFDETFGPRCKRYRIIDKTRPRIVNGLQQAWLLGSGRSAYRHYLRKEFQAAIDEFVREDRFDLIVSESQFLGYCRFPKEVPKVVDVHGIIFDNDRRTFENADSARIRTLAFLKHKFGKKDELALFDSFSAVVTTTQRDKELIALHLPNKKIEAIPNGVHPSFFEDLKLRPEPETMVFLGRYDYYPNEHGVLRFLDEILPRILDKAPQARLSIVGAYPTKAIERRAAANVTITGFVKDIRPFVARSRVFVIPLWIGDGIRGKALEAMAIGTPIVSTSLGCESMGLEHEKTVLFADTPEKFADQVFRLFTDQELHNRLCRRANDYVRQHYDWKQSGSRLDEVMRSTATIRQSDRV